MNFRLANKKQFFIGLISLFLGIIFYLACRPFGSSYFQMRYPKADALFGKNTFFLNRFGNSLPEFIHPFAFSFLGMGLISKTRKSRLLVCIVFFLMNILFEVGQRYDAFAIRYIPNWYDNFFILENARNYFSFGTFDFYDIIAIFLGAFAAFILSEIILRKRVRGDTI